MRRLALVTLLAIAACHSHASGDAGADAASTNALDAASSIDAAIDSGPAAAKTAFRAGVTGAYISSEAAQTTAVTVVQAMAGAPAASAADCDAIIQGLDVSFAIAGSKAEVVGQRSAHRLRAMRTRRARMASFARDRVRAPGRRFVEQRDRLLRCRGSGLRTPGPGRRGFRGPFAQVDQGRAGLSWRRAGRMRFGELDKLPKRVDQALGFAHNRRATADDPATLDVRILKAIALLHTNKLDDAMREVDAVAKLSDAYAPWKARFDEAKATKLWIEPALDDDVYPALLAKNVSLYGSGKPLGPMATVTLWNISGHALDVKVSLNIDDLNGRGIASRPFYRAENRP